MSINTNILRDWADRMAANCAPVTEADRDYLHRVAADMDRTRTERNIARSKARKAARVGQGAPPSVSGG